MQAGEMLITKAELQTEFYSAPHLLAPSEALYHSDARSTPSAPNRGTTSAKITSQATQSASPADASKALPSLKATLHPNAGATQGIRQMRTVPARNANIRAHALPIDVV